MVVSRALSDVSRAVAVVSSAVVVLAAASASADVVYTINFSGVSTGTITFANVGDVNPTDFTILGAAGVTCTPEDFVDNASATWSGTVVTDLDILVEDAATEGICDLVNGGYGIFGPGGGENGTFTVSGPPGEVPVLSPVAIAIFGSLLGAVGYRRLRGDKTTHRKSRSVASGSR